MLTGLGSGFHVEAHPDHFWASKIGAPQHSMRDQASAEEKVLMTSKGKRFYEVSLDIPGADEDLTFD